MQTLNTLLKLNLQGPKFLLNQTFIPMQKIFNLPSMKNLGYVTVTFHKDLAIT